MKKCQPVIGSSYLCNGQVLGKIKGVDESFGGVFVVAYGDCCHLQNVSGYNIFEACSFMLSLIFTFKIILPNGWPRRSATLEAVRSSKVLSLPPKIFFLRQLCLLTIIFNS